VVVLVCGALAYGICVAAHAKLDVFPDFVQPQVVIQTECPGLAPECRKEAGDGLMPAVAAVAATGHFLFGGKPAQFQGPADVVLDGFLDLVKLFLSVHEPSSDRVLEQGIPVLFEIGDFLAGQGEGVLLFLLERLSLVNEALVIGTGLVVTHKGVDALADRLHRRLVEDGLAEFARLLHHGAVGDGHFHNNRALNLTRAFAVGARQHFQ